MEEIATMEAEFFFPFRDDPVHKCGKSKLRWLTNKTVHSTAFKVLDMIILDSNFVPNIDLFYSHFY